MLTRKLIDYIGSLRISQGAGSGDLFNVLGWQKRFIRGAFSVAGDSALSIARGNGKSTLVAALACACLDGPLMVRRGEVVVVASSFQQSRIVFDHVLAFMDSEIQDRKRWRVQDFANQASLTDRRTGARVRCIASDPRRAHGLAPILVLADEPAQWESSKADRMHAALTTAMGKIDGSRLIALGTRPSDPTHWFSAMLGGAAAFSQTHAARPDDPPFQRRTWIRANPSLPIMPSLERRIRLEAESARRDPGQLAAFKSLRLNLGTSDVAESILLDPKSWEAAEGNAEQSGDYALGIDLGTSSAMSAASAYFPATGALDSFAVFPEIPSLSERGLADGVGNRYVRMYERDELLVAGQRVSDIGALLSECVNRWGIPSVIVCDRWREMELIQNLEMIGFPLTDLVTRGMGFKDGADDVRRFQRCFLEGRVTPVRSLLMRSALAEARTVSDPAGNHKLAKNAQGGRRHRAKDDAIASAILAVAIADRAYPGPRNAHTDDLGAVSAVS